MVIAGDGRDWEIIESREDGMSRISRLESARDESLPAKRRREGLSIRIRDFCQDDLEKPKEELANGRCRHFQRRKDMREFAATNSD